MEILMIYIWGGQKADDTQGEFLKKVSEKEKEGGMLCCSKLTLNILSGEGIAIHLEAFARAVANNLLSAGAGVIVLRFLGFLHHVCGDRKRYGYGVESTMTVKDTVSTIPSPSTSTGPSGMCINIDICHVCTLNLSSRRRTST